MSTNGISGNVNTYAATTYTSKDTAKKGAAETSSKNKDAAAVYEPSKDKESNKTDSTKKTYKRNDSVIQALKNEQKQREQQLIDLVHKTLSKQGQTLGASQSIFDVLKSGDLKFSSEDITKAKSDIAADGYWGVEKTSERMYSFAYALTGGDPSKADKMMAAIEKGYQQATKAWGGSLPSICQQTLEATREKIQAWKNGTNTDPSNNIGFE